MCAKPGWRLGAHARAAAALEQRGASPEKRAHHVERSARVGDELAIALLLKAAEAALPVHEYSPLQIKSSVVGYGRAEKGQLKRMVELLLGAQFPNSKYDLTDALGLAVTHAHVSGFLSRLRS